MISEKIKTFILSILVITSIILTTQIWFNVSIEGIFVTPKNSQAISDTFITEYDQVNLLKPNRIVINLGEVGMHTILFNEEESNSTASVYQRILDETENTLKSYMNKSGVDSVEIHTIEKLNTLRSGRNIELIFENHLDVKIVSSILEISQEMFKDIKRIDSVVISSLDDKLYISDIENNAVYEYKFKKLDTAFPYIISLAEKLQNPYGVFLNEAYPELYGPKVIIPISMNSYKLPVLSGIKETDSASTADIEDTTKNIVSKFFDFNAARSITDKNGTTIYTDGQGKSVRIEKSGLIEYMRYDTSVNASRVISKAEAVKISTDFVNQHLGFPEGTYIASVEETFQNGKHVGYNIDYKYSFMETPIILDSNMESNPIEVKIVGDEVKSYKRLVRVLVGTADLKEIRNPTEVLNSLFRNINTQIGVKHTTVENMYLGYYEHLNDKNKLLMIPAWIVEIEQKRQDQIIKSQYIINAETSEILKY